MRGRRGDRGGHHRVALLRIGDGSVKANVFFVSLDPDGEPWKAEHWKVEPWKVEPWRVGLWRVEPRRRRRM